MMIVTSEGRRCRVSAHYAPPKDDNSRIPGPLMRLFLDSESGPNVFEFREPAEKRGEDEFIEAAKKAHAKWVAEGEKDPKAVIEKPSES